MKFVIAILILVVSNFAFAKQPEMCRKYTSEQKTLINDAYSYGLPYDYGYTLAAIVVKESFVGSKVIRYNPDDPSTGLTMLQFKTLKDLSGYNHWDTIVLAEKLIQDDILAFEYAVLKLNSVKGTYWQKWKGYNGSGSKATAYANDIQKIITELKMCSTVRYSRFN